MYTRAPQDCICASSPSQGLAGETNKREQVVEKRATELKMLESTVTLDLTVQMQVWFNQGTVLRESH
jgi:hypothetical protein